MSFINEVLDSIAEIWSDFTEFMLDLPLYVLQGFLSGVAFIIESIPMPDFMNEYSVSESIPSELSWLLVQTNFPEALAIVSGGIIFYFTRRVLTLGIW